MIKGVGDLYETGKTCKECGRPLYAFELFGETIVCECECETKKREHEKELKAKRDEELRLKKLVEESGLPPRLLDCRFDNFEQVKGTGTVVRRCKAFAEKFGTFDKSVLLCGPQGSGKTHLAAAIANVVLSRGFSVRFARASDIPYEIQKSFDNPNMSESDVVEPLRRCSLLVLDDIGADKMTDYDRGVIQSLVDYRINYCRPTVYTTNLTEDDMNRVLDTRTVDRIYGSSVVLICNAPSYRRRE